MFGWFGKSSHTALEKVSLDSSALAEQKKSQIIDGVRCIKSRYGVYLRTRWTDATFHFCMLGIYGNAFSDYLDNLSSDFSFIDIGANQGLYSLIAARNPACKLVHSFEPVADNYQYLLDNLKVNHALQKSTAINAAIASTAGQVGIALKRGHSGGASLRAGQNTKANQLETITTINAAQLAQYLVNANNCVIKIDVEGFEATVIDELVKSAVMARTTALFYEIDERWTEPKLIREKLEACGFNHFKQFGMGKKHYDVLATRQSI